MTELKQPSSIDSIESIKSMEGSDDEIDVIALLSVVLAHWKLLVFGPLLAGLVALGITFLLTPRFTATTVFFTPQQAQSAAAGILQSLGALGGLAGAATGIKNPNDQFVSILKSERLQDMLIQEYRLMERYEAEKKVDVREKLDKLTVIDGGKKDNLIKVEFTDPDPVFAAKIANGYVEKFKIIMDGLAVTEAQQRRKLFEVQLHKTKEKLAAAEMALRSSGVNADALKMQPEAAVASIAQIQAQITAQQVKLSSLRSYLNENTPEMRAALSELSALKRQMAQLENNQTQSINPKDADYIAKFREFKYQEILFEMFAKQYEIARVDESREGTMIQVLDVAQVPERKSWPKRGQIAMLVTLGVGLMLLIWVLVRNAIKN